MKMQPLGDLVRIGPGRYRVVHKKPTGRKPGARKPVPLSLRVAGKSYCESCGRELNYNNRTCTCELCKRGRAR